MSATMPMMWMHMPGQTWFGAAASFLGMWAAMMAAMMLPSLAPALWRYRRAVEGAGGERPFAQAALVAAGYFAVWTLAGMAAFPLGAALAAGEMLRPALARAVPVAGAAVVLAAGVIQLSPWKAHHLACCREASRRGRPAPASAGAAWRYGLRLGLHCTCSCLGPMAILLVAGIADPRAMAAVGGAITIERLAPGGERAARLIGVAAVGAGVLLIARATGLA